MNDKKFCVHPPLDRMEMFKEWKQMYEQIQQLRQERDKQKEKYHSKRKHADALIDEKRELVNKLAHACKEWDEWKAKAERLERLEATHED